MACVSRSACAELRISRYCRPAASIVKPLYRAAARSKSACSAGPSDFNPGVPSANAVTSKSVLAQMMGRQKRSMLVNKRARSPFPGNEWLYRYPDRARNSPQFKTGDAESPLQPQRRDRAGVHAGRFEHRREPKILRQRDSVAVHARHIQENLAAAHSRNQGGQHRFGAAAVVGHQRTDLETLPPWTDHAPAG